jgi:hypothetical protein
LALVKSYFGERSLASLLGRSESCFWRMGPIHIERSRALP